MIPRFHQFPMFCLMAIALVLTGCATVREPSAAVAADTGPRLGATMWRSFDGEVFPFTRWRASKGVKTVVVAVHGLSGAASDFKPLGEYFQKRRVAVYGYALRGQGNDPVKDRMGDIEDPELWYRDLDTFLTLVRGDNPGARVFLYGESLGGLITVHGMETFSAENRAAVDGVILASPVVSLKDKESVSKLKYAALKGAITLMPNRRISLEKLAGDKKDMRITGDTDHRENLRGTPHAVDEFSFRLLGTLEKLIYGSGEKASAIEKPILVLYPANDLLTTAEDVEEWFGALGTEDKEKCLFGKSFHMLLHDTERGAVLERVREWLGRH